MFQALFYADNGVSPFSSSGIGEFYNTANLGQITFDRTGERIENPFHPLFNKFTEIGLKYPNITFYAVHSDGHRTSTARLNPMKANNVNNDGTIVANSNHNVMLHMVEGQSRALTMYSRFTVDPDAFQPVIQKQQWSLDAYNVAPVGHTYSQSKDRRSPVVELWMCWCDFVRGSCPTGNMHAINAKT